MARVTIAKIGLVLAALVVISLVVMMTFNSVGAEITCNSPILLLVFNAVFLTGIGIALSVISSKSYLSGGSVTLLLLGLASSALGTASLIAGIATYISVNYNITIFNIGVITAGGIQLLSAIVTLISASPTEFASRKKYLFIGYAITVGFLLAASFLVFLGLAPTFYVTSSTLTRYWILGTATIFFSLSSLLFSHMYARLKSQAVYWYSLALGLLAISLLGVAVMPITNGLLNWTARFAEYLAGLYFLASLLSVRKNVNFVPSQSEGLSQGWIDAFSTDKSRLEALFGNISEGFSYNRVVSDGSGKPVDFVVLETNEKFAELMGVNKQEIIGKRALAVSFFNTDSFDWVSTFGEVALTQKSTRFERYLPTLDKWLAVFVYGQCKGYFVALLDDVTERKKTEEALRKSQADLEAKNNQLLEAQSQLVKSERLAAIGELAGMVGHDLRNPLSGIKNASFLIRKKNADRLGPDGLEMLAVIDQSVDRADKIVKDLLDYSREIHLDLEETSPKAIVNYVLLSVKVPNNVKIIDRTENEPSFFADTVKLERVFLNLIKNAFDAMPSGGTLEVESRKSGDKVEFAFSDSGVGMSEEVMAKIFTPLFTTKAQGMGFGLSICKRIVEGHGGALSVSSKLGHGTMFTVVLPVKPKSALQL